MPCLQGKSSPNVSPPALSTLVGLNFFFFSPTRAAKCSSARPQLRWRGARDLPHSSSNFLKFPGGTILQSVDGSKVRPKDQSRRCSEGSMEPGRHRAFEQDSQNSSS